MQINFMNQPIVLINSNIWYDTVKAAALSQFIALSLTMERCYVGGGGGAQYRQGMAAAAVTPVTFVWPSKLSRVGNYSDHCTGGSGTCCPLALSGCVRFFLPFCFFGNVSYMAWHLMQKPPWTQARSSMSYIDVSHIDPEFLIELIYLNNIHFYCTFVSYCLWILNKLLRIHFVSFPHILGLYVVCSMEARQGVARWPLPYYCQCPLSSCLAASADCWQFWHKYT